MSWARIKHELTKERGEPLKPPERRPRWCPSCEAIVVVEEGTMARSAGRTAKSEAFWAVATFGLVLPVQAASVALEQAVGWRCPDCNGRTQAVERAVAREGALDVLRERGKRG